MTSDPSASPDRPVGPTPPLSGEPVPPSADLPELPAEPAPPPQNAVKFTRTAAVWSALVPGFLILIVLLIFIAQNLEPTDFRFLGWQWSLSRGIAILAAAVCGGLLTVAAGTARILQLRRAAKKNLKSRA